VGADAGLVMAYCVIALALAYFLQQRHAATDRGIFWSFVVIAVAGGTIHLLDLTTVWIPTYIVQSTVKSVAAAASLVTAIILVQLIPEAIAQPAAAELAAANRRVEREVHERQQAEGVLQRSEQYYRSLVENALDLITLLDSEGIVRYANPS